MDGTVQALYKSVIPMKNDPAILVIILCSCAILGLFLPAASAAIPAGSGEPQALVASADLNVTNASLANATIPARYQATPTLLEIGISTNDTSLDGPKGEMAAVPRTIGFSASPEMLAIVIVVIAAAVIGAWYLLKRNKDGKNKE